MLELPIAQNNLDLPSRNLATKKLCPLKGHLLAKPRRGKTSPLQFARNSQAKDRATSQHSVCGFSLPHLLHPRSPHKGLRQTKSAPRAFGAVCRRQGSSGLADGFTNVFFLKGGGEYIMFCAFACFFRFS